RLVRRYRRGDPAEAAYLLKEEATALWRYPSHFERDTQNPLGFGVDIEVRLDKMQCSNIRRKVILLPRHCKDGCSSSLNCSFNRDTMSDLVLFSDSPTATAYAYGTQQRELPPRR